ncbi:Short chain dehydrogenase-like protein 5 [Elsinoe fawcettii]|nr:Short chain dehydrogenase-like protein 5 [Elsinoe fawcettii]
MVTVLVTGASQGIGKGFVSLLLQRPKHTVIAAIRNPAKFLSELQVLPKADGSSLIIVKIDSESDQDHVDAIQELQTKHSITSIDIIIANAGITDNSRVIENTGEQIRKIFQVNAVAPVLLLNAAKDLLKASSTGRPKFVAITSITGSIASQAELIKFPLDFSPYGASKAALNWFVHRAHLEEEWLTAVLFHPGYVLTRLAESAEDIGIDKVALRAITPEQSAGDMLTVIDAGTREKVGGKFLQWDGAELPW